MLGAFDCHGRIGRISFLIRWLAWLLSIPIAAIICFAVYFLSEPADLGPKIPVWSPSNAAFVQTYLSWVYVSWNPMLVCVAAFLAGLRVFLCACVKRARDLGVEIPNVSLLPTYFLNSRSGMNVLTLLLKKGDQA